MIRTIFNFAILLVLFAATLCAPQAAAQTATKAPLRNPPLALEPGKTHLVFSGVTSNFPRISVWLFQGLYQTLPRGTFRGDILFIGDGAVLEPNAYATARPTLQ